jgi:hypothetical protein
MVVRLDLERHGRPLAEVEHARVFARALQDAVAAGGQALEEPCRVLVPAVLGPEQREDCELEVVRRSLEQLPDAIELVVCEAETAVKRFRD